jgi:hypothetical protein
MEAAKLPGVTFRGIHNSASPGSQEALNIILGIDGKGDIALLQPTRASFTDGGPLRLVGIGPCGATPVLHLTMDPTFADLRILTVADIVVNYDIILDRIRTQDWCLNGSLLIPYEP